MKTDPIYLPMRQPTFFIDGSIAQPGREPQFMCNDYRIKLKGARSRTVWVRVTSDEYRRAVIGQAFAG